jgi:hypothetical protein
MSIGEVYSCRSRVTEHSLGTVAIDRGTVMANKRLHEAVFQEASAVDFDTHKHESSLNRHYSGRSFISCQLWDNSSLSIRLSSVSPRPAEPLLPPLHTSPCSFSHPIIFPSVFPTSGFYGVGLRSSSQATLHPSSLLDTTLSSFHPLHCIIFPHNIWNRVCRE